MLVSCYFHSWFGLGFVDSKPNIDCHRVSELESLRKDFAAIQHSLNIFLNLTTKDQNNGSQWICQQGAFDLFAACLNWTFNKLKRFVIPEDFPLITSVISHTRNISIVLRHLLLPPAFWLKTLFCPRHTTYNGRGNSFHFPAGWRRRRRASSGRPSVLPPGRPSTSTLSAFQHPEPGAAAPRKQGKSLIRHQTENNVRTTQTQVKWMCGGPLCEQKFGASVS